MGNPYKADFLNPDGTTRLGGSISFTDPANQPGGSSSYVTGSGSPVGTVTPTADKPLYIDTDNGTLYCAAGPTDLDWIVFGPVPGNVGEATGLVVFDVAGARLMYLLAGDRDTAPTGPAWTLTDAYNVWNGNGANGLSWQGNGTDGEQELIVRTGAAGLTGTLQDKNGTMTLASGGIKFPTADPHIAGAWWDNAGTLTKSMG